MTIGIGMIGAGPTGRLFAQRIAQLEGVDLRAVCSGGDGDADKLAADLAIPAVHRSLDGLVRDGSLDAVYVVTPPSSHLEHVSALLGAGKHVLVEKPMAMNAGEVETMSAAAEGTNRILMEAFIAPFEPNIAAVRDAIGRIPQLRRVVLVKDQYSSRFDAYKDGQNPNAFDPAFGGGSIVDLGFYGVSLAVHLFGEPRSISATGTMLDSGADGQGLIVLEYDGFEVDCLHSKIGTAGIPSQIGGERAAIVFDDCMAPRQVQLLEFGVPRQHPSALPGVKEDLTRPRVAGHLDFVIDEFIRLIRDGSRQSSLHPLANTFIAHTLLDEARRQVGVRFPTDG